MNSLAKTVSPVSYTTRVGKTGRRHSVFLQRQQADEPLERIPRVLRPNDLAVCTTMNPSHLKKRQYVFPIEVEGTAQLSKQPGEPRG